MRNFKRLSALLLAVVLCTGYLPITAQATGAAGEYDKTNVVDNASTNVGAATGVVNEIGWWIGMVQMGQSLSPMLGSTTEDTVKDIWHGLTSMPSELNNNEWVAYNGWWKLAPDSFANIKGTGTVPIRLSNSKVEKFYLYSSEHPTSNILRGDYGDVFTGDYIAEGKHLFKEFTEYLSSMETPKSGSVYKNLDADIWASKVANSISNSEAAKLIDLVFYVNRNAMGKNEESWMHKGNSRFVEDAEVAVTRVRELMRTLKEDTSILPNVTDAGTRELLAHYTLTYIAGMAYDDTSVRADVIRQLANWLCGKSAQHYYFCFQPTMREATNYAHFTMSYALAMKCGSLAYDTLFPSDDYVTWPVYKSNWPWNDNDNEVKRKYNWSYFLWRVGAHPAANLHSFSATELAGFMRSLSQGLNINFDAGSVNIETYNNASKGVKTSSTFGYVTMNGEKRYIPNGYFCSIAGCLFEPIPVREPVTKVTHEGGVTESVSQVKIVTPEIQVSSIISGYAEPQAIGEATAADIDFQVSIQLNPTTVRSADDSEYYFGTENIPAGTSYNTIADVIRAAYNAEHIQDTQAAEYAASYNSFVDHYGGTAEGDKAIASLVNPAVLADPSNPLYNWHYESVYNGMELSTKGLIIWIFPKFAPNVSVDAEKAATFKEFVRGYHGDGASATVTHGHGDNQVVYSPIDGSAMSQVDQAVRAQIPAGQPYMDTILPTMIDSFRGVVEEMGFEVAYEPIHTSVLLRLVDLDKAYKYMCEHEGDITITSKPIKVTVPVPEGLTEDSNFTDWVMIGCTTWWNDSPVVEYVEQTAEMTTITEVSAIDEDTLEEVKTTMTTKKSEKLLPFVRFGTPVKISAQSIPDLKVDYTPKSYYNAEKPTYHSVVDPNPHTEMNQGTIRNGATGPTGTYNSMTGTPTFTFTEENRSLDGWSQQGSAGHYYQYFAAGGSEFVVEFDGEYHTGETATRTFNWSRNYSISGPCAYSTAPCAHLNEAHKHVRHMTKAAVPEKKDKDGHVIQAAQPAEYCDDCEAQCTAHNCSQCGNPWSKEHPHTVSGTSTATCTVTYTGLNFLEITNLQVWQLSEARLDGTRQLLPTNAVTATVQSTAPNISYNIAGASTTAASGRMVYDYQPTQKDTVNISLGSGSVGNDCKKIGDDMLKAVEDNARGINLGAWCVSDYIVLHTTAGDLSICYFEQQVNAPSTMLDVTVSCGNPSCGSYTCNAPPSASVTVNTPPMEFAEKTYDDMWKNNSKTAANFQPTDITYGGYNGSYQTPNSKYKSKAGHAQNIDWASTQAAQNKSGVYGHRGQNIGDRNQRGGFHPSTTFRLMNDKIQIPDNRVNGEYTFNKSQVFYKNIVTYSKGNFTPSYPIATVSGFTGKGFAMNAGYGSPDFDKVCNGIVVHNPVSNANAVIIPLDASRDQRVDHTANVSTPIIMCPGDSTCEYTHLSDELHRTTNYLHNSSCYSFTPYTYHKGGYNTHKHVDAAYTALDGTHYAACPYYMSGGSKVYTCNTRDFNAHGCIVDTQYVVADNQVTKTFNYTGNVQYVTLQPGTYVLEAYGGAGYNGAKGGYSKGTFTVTTPTTVYIDVGRTGTSNNGGGSTHIALANGHLPELSSNKGSILLVAGGGGNGSGAGVGGGANQNGGNASSAYTGDSRAYGVGGGNSGYYNYDAYSCCGRSSGSTGCTRRYVHFYRTVYFWDDCGHGKYLALKECYYCDTQWYSSSCRWCGDTDYSTCTRPSYYHPGTLQSGSGTQTANTFASGESGTSAGGSGYYGGFRGYNSSYGGGGGSGYANTSKLTGIAGNSGVRSGNGTVIITGAHYMADAGCYPTTSVRLSCGDPHHTWDSYWKTYTTWRMHQSGATCTGDACSDTTPIALQGEEYYTLAQLQAMHIVGHNDGTYHLSIAGASKCTTCSRTYVRDCGQATTNHRVVTDVVKAETGHYPFGDTRCWQACNEPANHAFNNTYDAGNGSTVSAGTFINLDYQFSIYFPNTGNFRGTGATWSATTSAERGKGYINGQDTTQWIKYKWVMFSFDTVYDGVAYPARTPVYLPVYEQYFTFYCPLENSEMASAEVYFGTTAINDRSPLVINSPVNAFANTRELVDKGHHHDANKVFYVDVVGRIGALTISDTGDFRYSNFFKKTVAAWMVPNVLRKVDSTKQHYVVTDQKDIRGISLEQAFFNQSTLGASTPNLKSVSTNTYGSFDNPRSVSKTTRFPLSPAVLATTESDPCPSNQKAVATQPTRVGYNTYLDFMTLGNYYGTEDDLNNPLGDYISIVPHYYRMDIRDGTLTPADVYMYRDGQPVLINDADRLIKFNTNQPLDTLVKLNWSDEAARRNYYGTEEVNTESVYAQTGIGMPSGTSWLFANYDDQVLTGRNRTCIGTAKTYGVNTNPGDAFPTSRYWLQGARWHTTIGLPSSAVFVKSGDPCTTDDIKAFYTYHAKNNTAAERNLEGNTNQYVIVVALEIYAKGAVWNLIYDGTSLNGSITVTPSNTVTPHLPGGGKPTYPGRSEQMPIVSVISINHSSKEDVNQAGTH